MDRSLSSTTNVEILEKNERIKRFGIECLGPGGADGITFLPGKWRPGGEYIQKLIVRNVSTSVKKLKYKMPATRYFSLAFPEVLVLSPGMFKEIDVIFRPVEHDPYDDTLYFQMQEGPGSGGFHVPIRAMIDKLIVSCPNGLDLGYCPTHQITTTTFQLVNKGEVDAPFRWEMPFPFVFDPSEGVISVGHSKDIHVSIFPTDASVFVARAVCFVGEGVHAIIPDPTIEFKISAISKYAYIVLSDSEITFGEVISGTDSWSNQKDTVLRNNSIVPTEFEVIREDCDRDEVFIISPLKGVIPPLGEISINIRFLSLAIGNFSLDRYTFRTPGNCTTTLTCRGMCLAPRVTLEKDSRPQDNSVLVGLGETATVPSMVQTGSAGAIRAVLGQESETLNFHEGSPGNSLNFGDLELGKISSRLFLLKNFSNRDVCFQVMADPNGIFQFSPRQGIIPAGSIRNGFPVKIIFSPNNPINYYRRIFVLVEDALPLFFDVLGSGFISANGEQKEIRPMPIRAAHVQAYRNRSVEGVGILNPDELEEMYKNDLGDRKFFAEVGINGTQPISFTSYSLPLTRSGDTTRVHASPAQEFFISQSDSNLREVVCNKDSLDFGYTPYQTCSDSQTLEITNNTNGKLTVCWEVPKMQIESTPIADLKIRKAGGSGTVNNLSGAFRVEPPVADINPGKRLTFKVYFQPNQSNRQYISELEAYVYFKNQRTFRLVDDHTLVPPWSIICSAMGHTFSSGKLIAKSKLAGSSIKDGKLVFPCTYVGDENFQTILLKNSSNLVSTFQFEIGWEGQSGLTLGDSGETSKHLGFHSEFMVKPTIGEVAANSFVLLAIRFTPTMPKKYLQLLRCYVNGSLSCKLILEGFGGIPYLTYSGIQSRDTLPPHAVSLKPSNYFPGGSPNDLNKDLSPRSVESLQSVESLDDAQQRKPHGIIAHIPLTSLPQGFQGYFYMKPTCVGLASSRTFPLRNFSRLPLKYKLILPPEARGLISLNPSKGILRGNEETSIVICFAPHRPLRYEFKIKCKVFPIGGAPRVTRAIIDARQIGDVHPPDLLQQLYFHLVAPGEVGALIFDPPRLNAQVKLVKTSQLMTLSIENISDSDIYYFLQYRTLFVPDDANTGISQQAQKSEILPLLKADESDVDTVHTPSHCLYCSFPEGLLPARSKKRIPFIFFPSQAGLFDFIVYAKTQAIRPEYLPLPAPSPTTSSSKSPPFPPYTTKFEGTFEDAATLTHFDPSTATLTHTSPFNQLSNEEALLLRVAEEDRIKEILAYSPSLNDLLDDEKRQDSSEKESENTPHPLEGVPLIAHITGRSAFPTLIFEDIRPEDEMLVGSIDALWKQFSLMQLNHDLGLPLTKKELKLNAASSPDISKVKRYPFVFTPSVVGTSLQSFRLKLRNSGFLVSSFHIHLPNEKELDLEQWCEEVKPSEEHNKLVSIIEELKCFSISPKEAILKPGESCLLTISYSHSHLKYGGFHKLPILVKVDQGKQFYIDLIGRTLPLPFVSDNMLGNNGMVPASGGVVTSIPTTSSTQKSRNIASSRSLASSGVGTEIGPSTANKGPSGGGILKSQTHDAPTDTLLWLPSNPEKVHYLDPVRLGLSIEEAPRQRIEFFNVSNVKILYEVDLSPVLELNSKNHGFQIVRISNPTGEVEPRSSFFLNLYFFPLEVKTYTFKLIVKYISTRDAPNWGFGGLGTGNVEEADAPSIGGIVLGQRTGTNSRPTIISQNKRRSSVASSATSSSSVKPSGTGESTMSKTSNKSSPVGIGIQLIETDIQLKSYLPCDPTPLSVTPELSAFSPPTLQSLSLPNQMASLSSDLLDFGLVPQWCSSHRLVIIRNLLEHSSIEFQFDFSKCPLVHENLLTISPNSGRIYPNDKIILNLSFSGICHPQIFDEKVKLIVREVISQQTNKRSSGTNGKLMSRIQSRKAPGTSQSTEHIGVLQRSTIARSNLIDATIMSTSLPIDPSAPLPFSFTSPVNSPTHSNANRQPSLPTSFNAKGQLVKPQIIPAYMAEEIKQKTQRWPGGSGTGGGGGGVRIPTAEIAMFSGSSGSGDGDWGNMNNSLSGNFAHSSGSSVPPSPPGIDYETDLGEKTRGRSRSGSGSNFYPNTPSKSGGTRSASVSPNRGMEKNRSGATLSSRKSDNISTYSGFTGSSTQSGTTGYGGGALASHTLFGIMNVFYLRLKGEVMTQASIERLIPPSSITLTSNISGLPISLPLPSSNQLNSSPSQSSLPPSISPNQFLPSSKFDSPYDTYMSRFVSPTPCFLPPVNFVANDISKHNSSNQTNLNGDDGDGGKDEDSDSQAYSLSSAQKFSSGAAQSSSLTPTYSNSAERERGSSLTGGTHLKTQNRPNSPNLQLLLGEETMSVRGDEVREMCNFVLQDIFSDLLISPTLKSTLRSILSESEAEKSSLYLPQPPNSASSLSSLPLTPIGLPKYGLYFEDIKPKLSLVQRFILELKYLGFTGKPNEDEERFANSFADSNSVLNSLISTFTPPNSSSTSNIPIHFSPPLSLPLIDSSEPKHPVPGGDELKTTNSPDSSLKDVSLSLHFSGLPSKWAFPLSSLPLSISSHPIVDLSIDPLLLSNFSSFSMSASLIPQGLKLLSITKKSELYKEFMNQIATFAPPSHRNPLGGLSSMSFVIQIPLLLNSLSSSFKEILLKKLARVNQRRRKEALMLRKETAILERIQLSNKHKGEIGKNIHIHDHLPFRGRERTYTLSNEDPTDHHLPPTSETHLTGKDVASIKIQSLARSKNAQDKINQKKDESFHITAQLLLANEPGFVNLMDDILRNTMFNLIQEASFGEFAIDSEPLSFMLRKEGGGSESIEDWSEVVN